MSLHHDKSYLQTQNLFISLYSQDYMTEWEAYTITTGLAIIGPPQFGTLNIEIEMNKQQQGSLHFIPFQGLQL